MTALMPASDLPPAPELARVVRACLDYGATHAQVHREGWSNASRTAWDKYHRAEGELHRAAHGFAQAAQHGPVAGAPCASAELVLAVRELLAERLSVSALKRDRDKDWSREVPIDLERLRAVADAFGAVEPREAHYVC